MRAWTERPQEHLAPEPERPVVAPLPNAIDGLQTTMGNAAVTRLLARARVTGPRARRGRQPTKGELWERILKDRLGLTADAAHALAAAQDSGRVIDDVAKLYEDAPGAYTIDDVVTLASVAGRSVADLLALAGHSIAATPVQVDAMARAGRVAGDLDALQLSQPNLAIADIIELASIPGRGLPELQVLAAGAAAGVGRPVAELAALAAIGAPAHRLTANESVQLAQAPVTLPVLQGLLGHQVNATPAQVDALARAGRTAGDLTALSNAHPLLGPVDLITLASVPGRNRAELGQLVNGRPAHRGIDDLATLAALGAPAHRLAIADVLLVAGVAGRTMIDLLGLLALGPPLQLTAAEVVAVADAGRVAADLTAIAAGPPALNRADTLGFAVIPGRSVADIGQMAQGLPGGRNMGDLATLAALGAPAHRLAAPADVLTVAATPGRSINDLTALLGHPLALTAAEAAAIGAAGHAPADLTTLTNVHNLGRADTVALASVPGRSMADLVQLIQGRPGHRPLVDLAAVAAAGAPAHHVSIAQALALGGIQNRTQADLLALAAGVPQLRAGRVIADLVTVASYGGPNFALTAADAALLVSGAGVPAIYTAANITTLVGHLRNLSGAELVQVATWLQPLAPAHALAQVQRLVQSGVAHDDVFRLLGDFNTAGENGNQIRARLDQYWNTYHAGDARDITRPRQVAPALAAGTRILTGPMLVQQIRALMGPNPAAAIGTLDQNVAKYPTGQDPAGLGQVQLWTDCVLANHPARIVGGAAPETVDEARIRQRLALAQLMNPGRFGYVPGIVQQIFSVNQGQTPRAIRAPNTEDALGAGQHAHTVDRHVLNGAGSIANRDDLAMRVLGHRPAAGMYSSTAGAFSTAGDAQTGIQNAWTQLLAVPATNWAWARDQLAQGLTIQRNVAGVAANGDKAQSLTGAIALNSLPPYTHPWGWGLRRLHTLDNFDASAHAAGLWAVWAGDGLEYLTGGNGNWYNPYRQRHSAAIGAGAPLATLTVNPGGGVTIRIIGEDVSGGFFVHAGWPY